jgi:hypothetical protein
LPRIVLKQHTAAIKTIPDESRKRRLKTLIGPTDFLPVAAQTPALA